MFSAAIQVRSSLEAKAPTRWPDLLEPPNVDKVGFEFEGPAAGSYGAVAHRSLTGHRSPYAAPSVSSNSSS